jgi:hypothetical protein
MAHDFGMTRPAAGAVTYVSNVNVTVQVPPTTNKADIGREVKECLEAYVSKGGRVRVS